MQLSQIAAILAFTASAVAQSAQIAKRDPPRNGGDCNQAGWNGCYNPVGLADAMKQRGREFVGFALTIRNDSAELSVQSNTYEEDFNSVTPENDMKWEVTEPQRNVFNFVGSDKIVQFATSRGYEIHCHNLVWHSQLPPWIAAGNFSNATLISIMENHIKNLAGRYADVCTRWDVVNEALNEDGTYRSSPWYNTIGEAFLPLAFKFAAQYSPKSKLYYNDYNLEYNGNKTVGAKRIVDLIKSYGVRIDGVGLQAHLTIEPTPSSGGGVTPSQDTLETVLKGFTKKGVSVVYTELDERMVVPATKAKLELQRQQFKNVASSCLAVKGCVGITLWGVSDKYSWIPGVFAGEGSALVWDENFQKKPAYYGMLEGIQKG
ncbi:Endo-1,4-beta-xylanase 2 [Cryoendolithus antarcticus]|uniref:Beta-xylanase n=1 Tax=Cryoendolithus antarcticus TaxID=1507870 RepID=A0A1V8SAP5_9PEZI|nr:Endo-1,4-beta-xylanase 2 [Cryoendolithus antarcticus]